MKLEWGKKVNCLACAMPFYSMQKTTLVCPYCGHKFDISELNSKKLSVIPLDIDDEIDDKVALSGFGFEDSADDIDLTDDSDLADKEVIEDIKLIDNE